MKKLLITIIFVTITFGLFGQSIFKPVPKNLFQTGDKALQNGAFLWRFSAQLTATEFQWDKASKGFISLPLSSVGPAIGFRHFVPLADGTPFNNWGVNASLLMGVDINAAQPASVKLAITADLFKLNVGFAYTFTGENHYGFLFGTSIAF